MVGSPIYGPLCPTSVGYPTQTTHACEVAYLLKARFRPVPYGGKKAKEMMWVTTCLTSDPTEDTTPKYSDWEACVSLYVAVDILTHHYGVRHSRFEGQSSTTAGGFLVIIACMLQQLMQNPPPETNLDMEDMATLADSFSFNEIKKGHFNLDFALSFVRPPVIRTPSSTAEVLWCPSDTCLSS
jgi:hypothetical protein